MLRINIPWSYLRPTVFGGFLSVFVNSDVSLTREKMEHNEESSSISANGSSVVTLNFSNYTFDIQLLSLQWCSGFF